MHISVTEAAQRLGCSQTTVRRRLLNGTLPGQKVGGQWLVYGERLSQTDAQRAVTLPTTTSEQVKRAFKHVLKNDLREIWVPDVIRWDDFKSYPDQVIVAAIKKCETGDADPFEEIEVPKGTLLSRSGALLSLPDRIAFQALCSTFAHEVEEKLSHRVFSSRLNTKTDGDFFMSSVKQWGDFVAQVRQESSTNGPWVVETDLVSYFETINHQILFNDLTELGVPSNVTRPLRKLLRTWRNTSYNGLPTGTDAARLLGNFFLSRIDDAMISEGFNYFRYMDDVRIVTTTERDARRALRRFEIMCRSRGLIVSSAKTKIEQTPWLAHHADDDFAQTDYLFKNGLSQARSALRELFGKALAESSLKKRHARFALLRLAAIVDRGILSKLLDRLEGLQEVSPDAAHYLRAFISEKKVQSAISEYLSGPGEPGLEKFQQAWLIAAMLEILGPPPEKWTVYARSLAWNANEPAYMRGLALNLVVLGGVPEDLDRVRRTASDDYNPLVARGAVVALCRVGALDRATCEVVLRRHPPLEATIEYLKPRGSLPSLLQEGMWASVRRSKSR